MGQLLTVTFITNLFRRNFTVGNSEVVYLQDVIAILMAIQREFAGVQLSMGSPTDIRKESTKLVVRLAKMLFTSLNCSPYCATRGEHCKSG